MKIRIILFLLSLLSVPAMTFAQKQERMHLRKGNALFEDSAYVDAEIEYRKALDADPKSVKAKYNLGNALANQEKTDDALKEYVSAAMAAKTKEEKARIYHNAGVALQKQKKYGECIEAYKNALKANPADDETRYNLNSTTNSNRIRKISSNSSKIKSRIRTIRMIRKITNRKIRISSNLNRNSRCRKRMLNSCLMQ